MVLYTLYKQHYLVDTPSSSKSAYIKGNTRHVHKFDLSRSIGSWTNTHKNFNISFPSCHSKTVPSEPTIKRITSEICHSYSPGMGKVATAKGIAHRTRYHCHGGRGGPPPLIFGPPRGRAKVKLNLYLPVLRRELHRTGGEALPIGTASLLGVCGSEKRKAIRHGAETGGCFFG